MNIGGDMLMQSPDINGAIDDPAGLHIQQASYENPYRYCGEYFGNKTGYVYLRARCYDPSICRFISDYTANGYVPIEEIESGDRVFAENPETGEKGIRTVVQTFVNETDELVHISVKDTEITTTPEHPFYVPQKGWTGAIHLRAGDMLVLSNGEYVVVEKIEHELLESPALVYNFGAWDFHTYYVSAYGVLVHNVCAAAKKAQLPTEGKIRYVPPKSAGNSLPRTSMGGYIDRFGNTWIKGSSRTIGEAFEWDVQLSSRGKHMLGWLSRDGMHLNVSLKGLITH